MRRSPLPVARSWENELPGDSGREVVTDVGEVNTDVVVGAMTDEVGTVELGGGVETGTAIFAPAGRGPVDDDVVCPSVAPNAPAVMAPEMTAAMRR